MGEVFVLLFALGELVFFLRGFGRQAGRSFCYLSVTCRLRVRGLRPIDGLSRFCFSVPGGVRDFTTHLLVVDGLLRVFLFVGMVWSACRHKGAGLFLQEVLWEVFALFREEQAYY